MLAILFPWDFILIFAVLAVLIPWRGAARVRSLLARTRISSTDRLAIYASTIAFQWFLAGLVAWRSFVRGLNLEQLALNIHSWTPTSLAAAGLIAILGILQYIGIRRTAQLPASSNSRLRQISIMLMPTSLIEGLVFAVLAITASICEEFLYRGFVYAALQRVWHPVVFALIGSSMLFSLAHLYQGRRGLITTFVLGLIFAVSRLWVGNLVPAVAGHLAVDFLAGFLGPRYLRKIAPSKPPEEEGAEVILSDGGPGGC